MAPTGSPSAPPPVPATTTPAHSTKPKPKRELPAGDNHHHHHHQQEPCPEATAPRRFTRSLLAKDKPSPAAAAADDQADAEEEEEMETEVVVTPAASGGGVAGSAVQVDRKRVLVMEGNPHPGAVKGQMSLQNFNSSIDEACGSNSRDAEDAQDVGLNQTVPVIPPPDTSSRSAKKRMRELLKYVPEDRKKLILEELRKMRARRISFQNYINQTFS